MDIKLHPRLTVITGANGSGKSSILKLFSMHFGYNRPFLSTPIISKEGGYTYTFGLFASLFKASSFFRRDDKNNVGEITYSNEVSAKLTVPKEGRIQYNISIPDQQSIFGIHIDSHQPLPIYRTIPHIPANIITPENAYDQYNSEHLSLYGGGSTGLSPSYRMKEAIIAMAMFGEPNSRSLGNSALKDALDGFIVVLRKVLPPSLGFLDLSIRSPEVVLETESGSFVLDAASGGVATLIDIAWRLHMFSLTKKSFVVTIDEPENHLHPSMQRSLMGRLLDAFPQAQFIVVTHSPFIVSSVRDSSVYVLRYHDAERFIDDASFSTTKYRIVSEKLDTINKSGSANEILRDVLGVEANVPEWVSDGIKNVVERYKREDLTVELLKKLRVELNELGYSDHYPIALAELTANDD